MSITKEQMILTTWPMFKIANTNSPLPNTGLRLKNGESEENIIQEYGNMVSTMMADIKSRLRYLDIGKDNGSALEGGVNV